MKSVVFCSSQRFKNEMETFIERLRSCAKARGSHIMVLEPNFEDHPESFLNQHEKDRLLNNMYKNTVAGKVYDHLFRKVRVADVCFIFNKDGYIGVNTAGELFAAAALGKTIYALHKKTLMGHYPNGLYEEPSPGKLVHEIVESPEELLERLL